nr:reverse transcriptase domain-containing protein [Tanacetum cinerariifolium]
MIQRLRLMLGDKAMIEDHDWRTRTLLEDLEGKPNLEGLPRPHHVILDKQELYRSARSKPRGEPFSIPILMMADNCTMEEMLQAPTEGSFNRITSTLKFKDVPNDAIKLMLFPYSLEGAAKIWIDKLTDTISNLVETFDKKMTTPATVKAVEETCVICGGAHPYYDYIATDSNILSACVTTGSTSLPSNTVPNPQEDLKAITTRSGVTLARPSISPPPPSKEVDREPKTITDQVLTGSTNNVPPLVVQPSPTSTSSTPISSPTIPKSNSNQPPVAQTQVPVDEPIVAPKPKPTIRYPSRANKQKLREKDDNLALKFVEIFRNLYFEVSFAYALLHMPKSALMFKSLLNNKEKLFDLATTSVNENCSAVILKKLPEKLGHPCKFLISYDFLELDECLALADLGAGINLMPLSIWRNLSLPELTFTQMILELADRLTTRPAGIAKDVFLKVGKPFLRTGRALIDVYGKELTLRIDDEAITFKEFTPTSDPIISSSSLSFTPFEGSDFILEEIETFLRTPNELSNLDDDYYDTEGDILYLEKLLNEDLSLNLPLVKTEDLKQVDATMTKPSIDEPPELKLKELPSHLEYYKGLISYRS